MRRGTSEVLENIVLFHDVFLCAYSAAFPPGFAMYPPHLMAAAQSQFLQPPTDIPMSIAAGNHGNQMLPNSFASFHHYNSLHTTPFDGVPSSSAAPSTDMNHKSLPNPTNKPIDKRKEGSGNAFLNNFKPENGYLPLPHALPVRSQGSKGSLSPRGSDHLGDIERSQGIPIIPTSMNHMMNPMMYAGSHLGWSPMMAPLDMETIKVLANRVDKPEDGVQKRPPSPHKDRDLKKVSEYGLFTEMKPCSPLLVSEECGFDMNIL